MQTKTFCFMQLNEIRSFAGARTANQSTSSNEEVCWIFFSTQTFQTGENARRDA